MRRKEGESKQVAPVVATPTAVSLLSQAFNGEATPLGAKKLLDACNVKGAFGPAKMTGQELTAIANGLYAAVRGAGTDEDSIKSNLLKIQTISDLCGMAKTYQTSYGESLLSALAGEIESQEEWRTYVFIPLLNAYGNTRELIGKQVVPGAAEKKPVLDNRPNFGDWSKFPCVAKHPKAKKSVNPVSRSEVYEINGDYYYPNGKKFKKDYTTGQRITVNYTCNDPEFKLKSNSTVKQLTTPSDAELDAVLGKL
jgi:hypothetical protein